MKTEFELISDFFNAIEADGRISITHIGIYAALLQFWRSRQYAVPLLAYSHEVMPIAKISSRTTYNKALRSLSDYGYLKYEPSKKKTRASKIYFS